MNNEIKKLHADLASHSLFAKITNLDSLKLFMKYHVFAVWDFMSLLKSLQREITCVSVPWFDSKYNPELVRLINDIVLAEESDVDQNGKAASHFALYLKAMDEVGADSYPIKSFLEKKQTEHLPIEILKMIDFHLNLAREGMIHEVASSFFFGREKLIPDMFQSIVDALKESNLECPTLIYYLEHHIELDGDEHGPKAMACLEELMDTDSKKNEVLKVAVESLNYRKLLWDFIERKIDERNQETFQWTTL